MEDEIHLVKREQPTGPGPDAAWTARECWERLADRWPVVVFIRPMTRTRFVPLRSTRRTIF